jgi:sugar-specific transcriptional regulator TrmB
MAPAVSLIPFFNVLAGMLHERLYSHMKDSLFPIIFENVQLMI